VRSLSAKVCAKAGPSALPELDDSGKCEGDCFLCDFHVVYVDIYLFFIVCNTVVCRYLNTWELKIVYIKCCRNSFCDFSASSSLNDCSLMASGLNALFRPTCAVRIFSISQRQLIFQVYRSLHSLQSRLGQLVDFRGLDISLPACC
jgi:hypothetical protein